MKANEITSVGCLDNHDGSIALAICISGQVQPVFVTVSKHELEKSGGINGLNERKQGAVDFFNKYGQGRPGDLVMGAGINSDDLDAEQVTYQGPSFR
tara:strand:+ start:7651 stop:7941 length:291 start_codon:yes stop_codon:yes gene_type:complete